MANYQVTGQYSESTNPSLTNAGWTLVSEKNGVQRGCISFQGVGATDVYLYPVASLGTPSPAANSVIVVKGGQTPPTWLDFPNSSDYWYAKTSAATGNDLRVCEMV
jgi:hypothetical protein